MTREDRICFLTNDLVEAEVLSHAVGHYADTMSVWSAPTGNRWRTIVVLPTVDQRAPAFEERIREYFFTRLIPGGRILYL